METLGLCLRSKKTSGTGLSNYQKVLRGYFARLCAFCSASQAAR